LPVVPDLLRAKVRLFAELTRKTQQLETLNAELEPPFAERNGRIGARQGQIETGVEEEPPAER